MKDLKDEFGESIKPIKINGLKGRFAELTNDNKNPREILLIYGHHASLERMRGLSLALKKYGNVTIPDLPGFGGMHSFYRINKKPDIDQFAEYLASYIKLKYKNKKFTIVSLSFGFIITTRMLQMFPKLTNQVEFVVAGVGFLSHDDLKYTKSKKYFYRFITYICSTKLVATITKYIILNKYVIKLLFSISERNSEFTESIDKKKERINFEIKLWKINDVRTHFYTLNQILKLNITEPRVNSTLWHIYTKNDQYLDEHVTKEHLKAVYQKYKSAEVKSEKHAPTVVATASEAMLFIPPSLRKELKK